MKFGLGFPVIKLYPPTVQPWEESATPADVVRIARTAEEVGFDYLGVSDHIFMSVEMAKLMGGRWCEGVTTITFLAGATEADSGLQQRPRAALPRPGHPRQADGDARLPLRRALDPGHRNRPPGEGVRGAQGAAGGARPDQRRVPGGDQDSLDRGAPRVPRQVRRVRRHRLRAAAGGEAPPRPSGSAATPSRRCAAPPSTATAGCPGRSRRPSSPSRSTT